MHCVETKCGVLNTPGWVSLLNIVLLLMISNNFFVLSFVQDNCLFCSSWLFPLFSGHNYLLRLVWAFFSFIVLDSYSLVLLSLGSIHSYRRQIFQLRGWNTFALNATSNAWCWCSVCVNFLFQIREIRLENESLLCGLRTHWFYFTRLVSVLLNQLDPTCIAWGYNFYWNTATWGGEAMWLRWGKKTSRLSSAWLIAANLVSVVSLSNEALVSLKGIGLLRLIVSWPLGEYRL